MSAFFLLFLYSVCYCRECRGCRTGRVLQEDIASSLATQGQALGMYSKSTRVNTCSHTLTRIHTQRTHTHIRTYIHIHTQTHTYITYTHKHTYTHTHTHTYTHTHIHTHTHTYIHKHTYTHIRALTHSQDPEVPGPEMEVHILHTIFQLHHFQTGCIFPVHDNCTCVRHPAPTSPTSITLLPSPSPSPHIPPNYLHSNALQMQKGL